MIDTARPRGKQQIEFVHNRERIKVLMDDTRSNILRAIRGGLAEEDGHVRRCLSVPEIARKLGESASKIYHHVDLLVEHQFLRIAREERKKRSTITFYERAADAFVIMAGEEFLVVELDRHEEFVSTLDNILGLDLTPDESKHGALLIARYLKNTRDALEHVTKHVKKEIPLEHIESVLQFLATLYSHSSFEGIEITTELRSLFLRIPPDTEE